MGLGVFIAITLVERIGGAIKLDNVPGSGARVAMSLPRVGLEADPIFDAGPQAQASDLPDAAQ